MKVDYKKFGKVAVLMGGTFAEREISLISGKAVLESLLKQGVDAYPIDVGPDFYHQIVDNKFDRAFIALHGEGGEDGVIQGALEVLKIPYTGSGVCASALAIDKCRAKLLWKAMGISTLDFALVEQTTDINMLINNFGLPLAIKPVSQGSSIGVTRVSNPAQFPKALELAMQYDSKVMAEPWIDGKELTVGVIGDRVLPVIFINTPQGFYDYEAKYFAETTEYHCPSGLTPSDEQKAQDLAAKAYQALGCRHWGRVDMMQDSQGKIWVLEVNTIPGLTDHSLVPKAAKSVGIDFDELVIRILEQTLQ